MSGQPKAAKDQLDLLTDFHYDQPYWATLAAVQKSLGVPSEEASSRALELCLGTAQRDYLRSLG